ncbi:hypothetical protein ACYSNW_04750 [Enterococcus sp. LJL99]
MIKLFKDNQEYQAAKDSSLYTELKEKGFVAEGEEPELTENEAAISELNEKIEKLEKENKSLKKENKSLKGEQGENPSK